MAMPLRVRHPSSIWLVLLTLPVLFLTCGCGSKKPVAQPNATELAEMKSLHKAGLEEFKKGNLEEADKLTGQVLEMAEKLLPGQSTELALIRLTRAMVLHSRNQFEASASESAKVVQALKDRPDEIRGYAQALGLNGGSLVRLGRIEESVPVLQQAVRGCEKSGDLLTVNGLSIVGALGCQLYLLGKYEEAAKYVTQAREICDNPLTRVPMEKRLQVLARFGETALGQKQWELALEQYQHALAFGTKHQVGFFELIPIRGGIAKARENLPAPK
jgi:tetratricopeptide (TPR) repeat protein